MSCQVDPLCLEVQDVREPSVADRASAEELDGSRSGMADGVA